MGEDHVARVLKLLEEGKISAAEAQSLLAVLRTERKDTSAQADTTRGAETQESRSASSGTKTFDFRWSQRRSFPVDFAAIGKQISAAVSRIDPEKIVKEARLGERLREFARMWQDDERDRPVNPLGLPTARRSETVPICLAPGGSLCVENRYGDIAIVGGSDSASLEIVREAWASTQVEAEIRLGGLDVSVQEPSDETEGTEPSSDGTGAAESVVSISVNVPPDWRDGVVNLTLRVPEDVRVTTRTDFGDTRIAGITGAVEAATGSGDISLDRLGGETRVEAVSGSIRATSVNGRLDAATKSGDVEIERLASGGTIVTVSGEIHVALSDAGELEARSVSGDIRIEHVGAQHPADLRVETVSGDAVISDVCGSLAIKSVSGDIVAERLSVVAVTGQTVSGDVKLYFVGAFSGTVQMESVSGDVTVAAPDGSSYRFELRTRSGDLVCEHPSQDALRTESQLSGTIGTGTGSILIKTLSGDVQITRSV